MPTIAIRFGRDRIAMPEKRNTAGEWIARMGSDHRPSGGMIAPGPPTRRPNFGGLSYDGSVESLRIDPPCACRIVAAREFGVGREAGTAASQSSS